MQPAAEVKTDISVVIERGAEKSIILQKLIQILFLPMLSPCMAGDLLPTGPIQTPAERAAPGAQKALNSAEKIQIIFGTNKKCTVVTVF